jgi:putative ABC transport system permease protein
VNSDHLDYIIKDLHSRGLLLDDLKDEIIDHVCSAVEERMNGGDRFADAYEKVIESFGSTPGLHKTQKETAMLQNFFTVAFRNLKKQSFYTLINVGGLAIGIASCLIIMLFVINELSYDRTLPNVNRLYRVNTEIQFGPNHFNLATTSPGFMNAASNDYPEIEALARVTRSYARYIESASGAEAVKVNSIFRADSSFFNVLQLNILEGEAASALKDPSSIAISESVAEKYFGSKRALGESIKFSGEKNEYKVGAVYEDLPATSHFHPELLMSMVGDESAISESLVGGGDYTTYVLLRSGVSPKDVESKFDSFVDRHVAPQIGGVLGGDFTMEKFRAEGQMWEYTLTPVADIHLYSDKLDELEGNGSIVYVLLLSSIGILILGIACVNFINLSTARSSGRAKEVGIRKAMGSLRTHLVRQFLVESTLLTFIAFMFSLVLAALFIPYFNELALQNLSIPFSAPMFYAIFVGSALVIGITAGIYPSFFLSAFSTIKVLKGQLASGSRRSFVRSSLVVFQFVISIFLIIATIVIQRQINFIQERKLGFQKEQVLVVKDASYLRSHLKEYKDEVLKNSFIQSGTITGFLPVSGTWRSRDTFWPEGVPHEDIARMVSLLKWGVDDEYVTTMGMKIVEGRNFDSHLASDSAAAIINRSAIRALGFDQPLGKTITEISGQTPEGLPDPNQTKTWTVVGVVEDFHYESMKEAIEPLALFMDYTDGYVALRFDAAHTDDAIHAAEATWRSMAHDRPFVYSFLDDDFARMYGYEKRLGKIFATFSVLAIIIACLGLFALTAFTAEQRTKEIGIRKVLGASMAGIVILLSREFGKLILIAFAITTPLAWYSVNWWLTSYSYKTEVGVWVYLMGGVIIAFIALLTMSYQSIKAALMNPVKSLRSE